jgi:hypothetical protein
MKPKFGSSVYIAMSETTAQEISIGKKNAVRSP